ncbi:MAG TPA: hypothetical protein VHC73_02150 [Vitreimonas sp.]|mgnify:CR=1|jgi:hypothetical protein|nr:hypothetical protein [Vitreimonas sp.]
MIDNMPANIKIIECACGRRFAQTTIATDTWSIGRALCPCGEVLSAWAGLARNAFEPESKEDAPSRVL